MMKKVFAGMTLIVLLSSIFFGAWGEPPASQTEAPQTLEALLGEDYARFLTETITMQMENRMEKNPEIRYFPIVEQAPLEDYAAIGEQTRFEIDQEGYLTIIFPGGTVAAAEHGEQRFRVIRVAAPGSASQMAADLEALSSEPRPIGSAPEAEAAQYIQKRFQQMGYSVTLQSFTNEAGATGTNVIAARPAAGEDADILVLSAHHDSDPSAYGANDNASGVTALLAAAEALKDVPTDTELRFISFTDEENGKNGSRAYTQALAESERARMIGDIQLDMLGGLGSSGLVVSTMDGSANWLCDLLLQKNEGATPGAETASDHASFQLAGIPAVLVMQNGRGYLYHSMADTAGEIDLEALEAAVSMVTAAAKEIMSPDTASYRQLAREQADGYTYRQTRQNVIYFSSSLSDTEAYIGAAGEFCGQREVKGTGWTDVYDTYRYAMRWFGGETPMNTYYSYRNGFLESIEIRPEETGYTPEAVQSLIHAMYGQPNSTQTGEDGITTEGWADEIYSKYISLRLGNPSTVTVSNYSVGVSNVRACYPVEKGEAHIQDEKDAQVWAYLCAVLPAQARQKIAEFNLFSDGYSNILAYTTPIRDGEGAADNTRFSINIDYYDVFDENGAPRDWSKLTYTILHEYGHVLLEDETQIDLSVGTDTHDPAGFVEGSFRKVFYDRFWKDLGVTAAADYAEHPTSYVSRYGANYFHEDIADTFALFVLGAEPEGSTVAEEKLRFFWEDAGMTALRREIRSGIGLAE